MTDTIPLREWGKHVPVVGDEGIHLARASAKIAAILPEAP
jgi:hypothetical protein